MPEIITKYPDIVLKLLQDIGARCGQGAPQKILTACPPERFCSLPTGELCVYGLNEIPQMTQVSTGEIARIVSGSNPDVFIIGVLFIVGIVVAFWLARKK